MALDILGPANAPNSVTDRPADDRSFGVTDTWFKDCSSSTANDGTKLKAALMNAWAGFARGIVRMNGATASGPLVVTESNADDAMAAKSIQHLQQRGQVSWAIDSGTADAMVIALTPPPPEYKAGMIVTVRKSNVPNASGSVTINVNGLGAKAVVRPNGLPVGKGDLNAGQVLRLGYDGTSFQLLSLAGGDVVPRNSAVLATAGSSGNWTVPAGVSRLFVEIIGGGGGGGGGTGNGGSGGGAGGYAYKAIDVTPGQLIPYVVGVGGPGGGGGTTGSNGTDGGTSSFGGFSSTGGGRGNLGGSPNGGAAGFGAGGDFVSFGGGGQIQGGAKGGEGGGSYYGSGGLALVSTTSGSGGVYGSGGAGGWNQQAGGSGAGGVIIIKY